jgi:ABC-2 type transport system permease protein
MTATAHTNDRPADAAAQPAGPATATRSARSASARPSLAVLGLRQAASEVRQFLRSREQVVFTMLFPVIMIVIFGSIFTGDLGGGVKFTQYFVTGMIASGLMVTGFQALAIQIPIERDRGVLKRLRGTPMPQSVYFIGKVGMVFTIAAMETVILLAVAIVFFGVSLPRGAHQWLTLGWVSLLGITACTLCGIAFSSIARTGRSAPAVTTPVALVLQFISGVFFVFTQLPPWMRQVASLFPLKWMCQGMRSVFLPDAAGVREAAGSWELGRVALILGAWCVGGLILCLTTFRWTPKRES